MKIPVDHVKLARVLHEDDDFITIEVVKKADTELDLTIGPNRLVTLMFLQRTESQPTCLRTYLPWAS